MQSNCRLYRSLGVKFRRKRDFEQHILHDIAAVRALKPKWLSIKQDVVETPCLRRQNARVSHLTGLCNQSESYRPGRRIARSPTLTRSSVGRMTVRSK